MDLDVTNLIDSLEEVATLLSGWKLSTTQWSLLDGPAIKLHDHSFDASPWRDHLNIYVVEHALPWKTAELEQTVPPLGSRELTELLAASRRDIHLHLVPAFRYYKAGFERKIVYLPSGRSITAATLRGCSQMWSYKSVEVVDKPNDFAEEIERIVAERLVRLRAALAVAREPDILQRLALLERGYQELSDRKTTQARATFRQAAGQSWISEVS